MDNLVKFKSIVDSFYKTLTETPERITGRKLSKETWSLKEIIGHLIDSASNNHQRFVRLQFGNLLDFPAYDAESWIRAQRYADMDWKLLINLWYSFNCVLLKIIEHMDSKYLENEWINGDKAMTLSFLVNDYYRHMKWHIEHFEKRVKEINDYNVAGYKGENT